jgi:hypothetical protein
MRPHARQRTGATESVHASHRIEPTVANATQEPQMNRYEPRPPRALFGLAAAAITVATLAIAVVLPAAHTPQPTDEDVATRVASERCLEQDGTITAIDVVGARRAHAAPIAQSRAPAPTAS